MNNDAYKEWGLPDDGRRDGRPLVWATPAQLFAGLPVGVGEEAICTGCGDAFGVGDRCTVYGYRPVEAWEWDRRRCFCVVCAPTGTDAPTLGTTEVFVAGEIGVCIRPGGGVRLCLWAVETRGSVRRRTERRRNGLTVSVASNAIGSKKAGNFLFLLCSMSR